MKKIGIIYHSGYGHTKKVAETLFEALKKESSLFTTLHTAQEATENVSHFDDYAALIFGAPTYMGGPSAAFKQFTESTAGLWSKQKWKNKYAAGFTNSGTLAGDKLCTLEYLSIFAAQHGMLWISLGILPALTKTGHGATPEVINRTGSSLGLATQSDDTSPEQTPSPGDLETTRLFAQRIAQVLNIYS